MDARELTLRNIARGIVERRLETPALLFLELHLPLTTLFHSAVVFAAPLATPLFGAERMANLQELLSDRGNVERLIELINEGALARDGVPNS